MINVSAYPQCARILHFQKANLAEAGFTKYWAAVCVVSDLSDTQLTEFGGFDFKNRSDSNGAKLLSRLEQFLTRRTQRYAANSFAASEGLKALLGARGVKTSMLKSEEDFWLVAETLFPGKISRTEGITALYNQIHGIPKKERKRLGTANLKNVRRDWVSTAAAHQDKIGRTK